MLGRGVVRSMVGRSLVVSWGALMLAGKMKAAREGLVCGKSIATLGLLVG